MNKDYTLCFFRSDAKIGCNKVDLEPEKAKTKMTINRGGANNYCNMSQLPY